MEKIKLFLLTFIASALFFLGTNFIYQMSENYFFEKAMAEKPLKINKGLFSANIESKANEFQLNKCEINQIKAKSYLSVLVNQQGESKVLFQKQPSLKLPLASLTKLLSAVVAAEFYSDTERIKISSKAVSQLETNGDLKTGEWLSKKELLSIMLIESSNDAAFALTEPATEQGFVGLMNLKAKKLKMENSIFFNPTGLDPADSGLLQNQINLSTANDLALLLKDILQNHFDILEITGNKNLNLYLENGSFHHALQSTNQLLEQNPYIIGGKTGLTERALGCLIIVLKTNNPNEYIINVLLGSLDRFAEMEILNNCSLKEI